MRKITDLSQHLANFSNEDGIFTTPIPRVSVIRSSAPTVPELVFYEPAICIVAQGVKESRLGNQTFRYNASQYLLGSMRLPVLGAITSATAHKPYLCLRLDLNAALIAELIAQSSAEHYHQEYLSGLSLGAMNEPLVDTAVRIAELLSAPQHIGVLAQLYEKELIWQLLQSSEARAVLCQMVSANSQMYRIQKAISWLEAHYAESTSLEQLASLASMAPSSFHKHFKRITGTSPIRFRTHLRLMAARRLMVVDGVDAAQAGFKVGYKEPAQFSREYARQFGLPPKRDTAHLSSRNQ